MIPAIQKVTKHGLIKENVKMKFHKWNWLVFIKCKLNNSNKKLLKWEFKMKLIKLANNSMTWTAWKNKMEKIMMSNQISTIL